ncbi:hypothetical protein BpHYR1_018710 [Brachionus plicatilis]|uniref:Uncharacterized protein n=1 Tax=Brachionus plicatilis TaxID=10195 RepID=A0A3M7SYM0_BRAPC|nr:hypothetical protein BpHYR1_018710 [Brachionus plicatilis]
MNKGIKRNLGTPIKTEKTKTCATISTCFFIIKQTGIFYLLTKNHEGNDTTRQEKVKFDQFQFKANFSTFRPD